MNHRHISEGWTAQDPHGPDLDEQGNTFHRDSVEAAVLRSGNGGRSHHRSLGDLIVATLTHGLYTGTPGGGVDWPSFEGTVLETLGLELKVLAIATGNGGEEPLDSEAVELLSLTAEDMSKLLHALARRAEAAAELSRRLRTARWGHPSFGGESPEFTEGEPAEEPEK
jgi:hypothetical protein